ncbi:hypothetical protein GQ53DRAFT_546468 [Thozetella sp. PMI_491]|nr:hypothetical protein GQ53DRAFT_546468 [Thozetella sp. PMI_491]
MVRQAKEPPPPPLQPRETPHHSYSESTGSLTIPTMPSHFARTWERGPGVSPGASAARGRIVKSRTVSRATTCMPVCRMPARVSVGSQILRARATSNEMLSTGTTGTTATHTRNPKHCATRVSTISSERSSLKERSGIGDHGRDNRRMSGFQPLPPGRKS